MILSVTCMRSFDSWMLPDGGRNSAWEVYNKHRVGKKAAVIDICLQDNRKPDWLSTEDIGKRSLTFMGYRLGFNSAFTLVKGNVDNRSFNSSVGKNYSFKVYHMVDINRGGKLAKI